MFKNVAGQRWRVFVFDTRNNDPIEGIAETITANLTKDYGTPAALTDVNPTEDANGGGYYWFDMTQTESNGHHLAINPESSHSEFAVVLGDPPHYITTDTGALAVVVVNPVNQELRQGTDHLNADGRALYFASDTEDQWPSLAGATVTFIAKQGSVSIQKVCTVTLSSGGIQTFYVEFTKEELTQELAPTGNYRYHILAELASGNLIPLITDGTLRIEEPYGVNY